MKLRDLFSKYPRRRKKRGIRIIPETDPVTDLDEGPLSLTLLSLSEPLALAWSESQLLSLTE